MASAFRLVGIFRPDGLFPGRDVHIQSALTVWWRQRSFQSTVGMAYQPNWRNPVTVLRLS
jgi:hypothetical protein